MKKIVLVLMAVLCLNACEKEDEAKKAQVAEQPAAQQQEVAVVNQQAEDAVVEQPKAEPVILNPDILKKKNFRLSSDKSIVIGFNYFGTEFFGRVVNNYFGKYEASEGKIKLETSGTTKMLGSDEEMQKEQKYLEDLAVIDSFKYQNKTLTLTGPNIELVFDELE